MVEDIEVREDSPAPVDKSCCFSFPLRYGLTNWGYFKMVVLVSIIFIISDALLHTCVMLGYIENGSHRNRILVDIAVTSVVLSLFVTDLLLTTPFILGSHQKNEKLLRAFYIFSLVTWTVTILLSALAISISMESWLSRYTSLRSFFVTLLKFSAYHISIIVQTYFVVLLKREINNMSNTGQSNIKYVNQDAKADTIKKSIEKMADSEMEIGEE